jgi:hypothetical protein
MPRLARPRTQLTIALCWSRQIATVKDIAAAEKESLRQHRAARLFVADRIGKAFASSPHLSNKDLLAAANLPWAAAEALGD